MSYQSSSADSSVYAALLIIIVIIAVAGIGVYSYLSITPSSSIVTISPPNVKIVNVSWQSAGVFGGQKNSINQNDKTSISFKIESNSQSVYSGLVAEAALSPNVQGIEISPSTQAIETLGPQGTSQSYTYDVQTVNAPPGTYTISILVTWNNLTAASTSQDLTVTA
ncbi:MAG TPA: hypothetical protein VNE86_02170 [Nitrososphaerales archaeon]|nr:hypothetical protein [Nitrososphaerales archaeon]